MRKALSKSGFTLIELSIAITLGLLTGGMVMALFNHQLAFLRIYHAQNFLTEEAPMISLYVSRLIGKADRFRLHDSVADARTGANPRSTPSKVVVLNFRQPDGTAKASILAFENKALNYYITGGATAAPEWSITRQAEDISFFMEQGVLRMALTGPSGELITYSGTMQQ